MEDSPAKTFPLQEEELDWMQSEADYFSRSLGLSANYDLASSSWRTLQRLLFEDQNELLASFAASGMTVDGAFYPLQMWARITDVKDGGYWRTPDTGAGGTSGLLKKGIKTRKSGAAITMRLVDQVNNPRMWPTPNVGGGGNPPSILRRKGNHFVRPSGKKAHLGLDQAVKMWPTPTVQDAKNNAGPSQWDRHSDPLNVAVKRWATPRACDGNKGIRTPEGCAKERQRRSNGQDLPTQAGGSLNPTWVEWLMGYPCGWTVLEDLVMQWFRPKREKPLKD